MWRRSRLGCVAALALVAGLLGCGADQIQVLTPDLPDSITRIGAIVIGPSGTKKSATGLLPRSELLRLDLGLQSDEIARVLLVGYSDAQLARTPLPDEATLQDTPIELLDESDAPLPPPNWYGTGSVQGDRVDVESSLIAFEVTAAWAEPCTKDACDRFPYVLSSDDRPQPIDLGDDVSDPRVILRWQNAPTPDAFVVTQRGYYKVTPPNAAELLPISTTTMAFDAVLLGDKQMALVDRYGQANAIGHPESGFDWSRVANTLTGIARLEVSRGSAPTEIYELHQLGPLFQWTDLARTELHDFRAPQFGTFDLEWLAPGRVAASFEVLNEVAIVQDGQVVRRDPLPRVAEMGLVEGLGLVASAGFDGATPGQLYLWDEPTGTWDVLVPGGQKAPAQGAEQIWPIGPGQFLYAASEGELWFYDAEIGVCEFPRLFVDRVIAMAVLEHGLLFGVEDTEQKTNELVLFAPERAEPVPPACVTDVIE